MPQQINPKVRPCSAKRNFETPRQYQTHTDIMLMFLMVQLEEGCRVGMVARRKPLLFLGLNKPKNIWKSVLWTDETKVEMSDHDAECHIS